MYSFEWDKESNGYLLSTKVKFVNKEVRPVYFEELDLLGFNEHFNYDKNVDPILWAEARKYYYKGDCIADVKGGSLYTKPQLNLTEMGLSLKGTTLEIVNIKKMIRKNQNMLNNIVSSTCEQIYEFFKKYENVVDAFYVAFSGGKDSLLLLDLVYSVLPENSFYVVFGDTKMETSDTYRTVDITKKRYEKVKQFITATTKFSAKESWTEFGPPSRVLRWCCHVHKSTPSILKLKEVLNNHHAKVMSFNGVRAEESLQRSTYDLVSDGVKHNSQINCSPILKWSSAELYLYLLDKGLMINDSYRKGMHRVGCLFCPMASDWYEYLAYHYYSDELQPYLDIIKKTSAKSFRSDDDTNRFIENGGWKARKNGVDIKMAYEPFSIVDKKGTIYFVIDKLNKSWYEWIKTLNYEKITDKEWVFFYREDQYKCIFEDKSNKTHICISSTANRINPTFLKYFKATLYKSIFCKKCRVCEIDCDEAAIKTDPVVQIDQSKCVHCYKCLQKNTGCIAANSLRIGGRKNMSQKGMCGYNHFGIKADWIEKLISYEKDFWDNIIMGKPMVDSCRKWFRESEICIDNNFTKLLDILIKYGAESKEFWEIVYVNLANNSPLIRWFIYHCSLNACFDSEEIYSLMGDVLSASSKNSALLSLKNTLANTPFSKEFGCARLERKGKTIQSITRKSWFEPDNITILYSLYKFAENIDGGWYSFSFSNLINDTEERKALSPIIIFGITELELQKKLQALDIDYPEFISVAFKKGLDNIDLRKDKSSQDILELILAEGI